MLTIFRYSYPPPNPIVLCNIAHTLVAVPKFYTQVLHLMNKMNLPCPFGPLSGEPPLCQEAKNISNVFNIEKQKKQMENNQRNEFIKSQDKQVNSCETSDSESELESDEDKMSINKNALIQPPKRPLKPKPKKVPKRPKLEALKQSLIRSKENIPKVAKESSLSVQEVFENPNIPEKKKLSVNVQSKSSVMLDTPETEKGRDDAPISEGFGKIYPQFKEASSHKTSTPSPFITVEELSANRVEESGKLHKIIN